MTTTNNFKGITFPSFTIGKHGVTLFQGTTVPNDATGKSGDLYIYANAGVSSIYQKQNTTWVSILATAGTVKSIVAGTDLTGGTITSNGTLNLVTQAGLTPATYNNVTVNAKGIVTSASNAGYISANQNITVTGDATGTGSTAITLTLGTSGVTAGTYNQVTVDAKGRVTSGTNVATGGTGTVTSIATGTGLTGGPIVGTGTIAMAVSGATAGTYGNGSSIPQITVDALGRITAISTAAVVIPNNVVVAGGSNVTVGTATALGTTTYTVNGQSSGSGTLTSIIAGTGLTGGTITGTGTIALGTTGVTAGTYNQVTVDILGRVTAGTSVSSSSANNTRNITQAAHSFVVGNLLALSGTSYVAAKADTAANAEVIGIVSAVIDANTFTLTTDGIVTGLTGLTAGSAYFLSAATAGLLTAVVPSTVGQIVKPVLVADSATSGYFNNMRGQVLSIADTTSIGTAGHVIGLLDGANTYSGQQVFGNVNLSDAGTVAWDLNTAQVATFTFVSTNRTVGAPTNMKNGGFYSIAIIQNAGGNTLTWNSAFKWSNGAAPSLSIAAGSKDFFMFRSDGTNMYEQDRSLGVA